MIVLFVDDDPDDFDLFCEAVNSFYRKATCLYACDGQEALHQLNHTLITLPDFILLDINMPKMGGKECLTKIKATPRLKKIPVIVYSTTSVSAEIQKFMELGATGFIVKPNSFNELVTALKAVLI